MSWTLLEQAQERLIRTDRSCTARYSFAIAATVVAAGVRGLLDPYLGEGTPFIFFFPAVMLAGWYGGLNAGMASTILATVIANYFWVVPRSAFSLTSTGLMQTFTFFFSSTFISFLCGQLHRALERRSKAEQELRVTIESIGDAVIATDRQGVIVFLNPTAERLTGWPSRDATGRPIQEVFKIFNETDHKQVTNPVYRVLAENITVGLANHTVLVAKDGAEYAIDDSAAPIRDALGNILGVVLVFHDVTERRNMEKALAESHARAEQILSSITNGFAVFDKEWRYAYINDRAAAMSRLPKEALLGKKIWDVFPDLKETAFYFQLHQVMRERNPVNFEFFYAPFDSWVEVHVYPSADHGVALYLNDITQRKRAEAALARKTEELELKVEERTAHLKRTLAEAEEFSYTVAHDFRAPLRAMSGYSSALLEDYKNKLDADGEDFLKRINRAANRLDRLVQDVLSYSSASAMPIELGPVDVNHLLDDVLHQNAHFQLPSAHVIIQPHLPKVLGHEALLAQAFTNLIGNAVKYVSPGDTPHIQITAERTNEFIRICFKDNGIGIPAEQQKRLFQTFVRLHNEQSYEGTGIGLAIVRKAAERMGGNAGVFSSPGEGSTFWIELKASP